MRERLERAMKAAREIGCRCLVCGGAMGAGASGLECSSGHSVNINRKGYFNFLSRPVSGVYDRTLFQARSRILAAGYYESVAGQIGRRIPERAAVLDIGCGDGYYLKYLRSRVNNCRLAGVDISRDAIETAADGQDLWCVADMRRLPFQDAAFDVILNILSPADYAEFRRLLKPDGLLIKVTPGPLYLQEIRAARGMAAGQESAAGEYLSGHMHCLETVRITETRPVSPEVWTDFVRMTPLNQDLSEAEYRDLAARPAPAVTVDLNVLIAKK